MQLTGISVCGAGHLSFTSHSSLEVPISQTIMWKRGWLDSVRVRRDISNLMCNILHVCGGPAGKHWIKSMLLTASLFPFLCFGIGFFLNFIAIYYHSLAAIPFGTMVSHPNSGRFLVDQDLQRYVNLSFLVLEFIIRWVHFDVLKCRLIFEWN